jgi:hypothetical protein
MLDITDDLIRATVSASALAAAQAYLRAGRVREMHAAPDGNRITAKVQGSARKPYAQSIVIKALRNGSLVVTGVCTCPVGRNCKHVGAVLLAQRQAAAPVVPRHAAVAAEAPQSAMEFNAPPARAFSLSGAPAAPAPVVQSAPALPAVLTAWLRELTADAAAESETYPEGVSKRLYYVLTQGRDYGAYSPQLVVRAVAADVKRDGGISQNFTQPDPAQLLNGVAPKYLRPSDRAILRHLNNHALDAGLGDPEAALRQILATGRARLGNFPGMPARPGPPRDGALDWRL